MRFALMHATLLGGAVGLALGINPIVPVVCTNLATVALAGSGARRDRSDIAATTTVAMVLAIAAALAVVHVFGVPARDTLALLWGDILGLREIDLVAVALLGAALIAAAAAFHRPVAAVLYDRDVARSLGYRPGRVLAMALVAIALTVSVGMRLVGALLLDALVVLPAVIARRRARSFAHLLRASVVTGVVGAAVGFLLALIVDLPVGSAVALTMAAYAGFTAVADFVAYRSTQERTSS